MEEELFEKLGVEEVEPFWGRVGENLRLGRVRLILAADKIPQEVLKIVEFLNDQMERAEILALEIRQFVGEDRRRTLVPRVLGATVAARVRKETAPRRSVPWTPETFLERVLSSNHSGDAGPVKLLIDWAKARRIDITGGIGGKYPPLYFRIEGDSRDLRPFYIPGAELSAEGHYRSIPLSILADEEKGRAVLAAMSWVIESIGKDSRLGEDPLDALVGAIDADPADVDDVVDGP